jgi:hypothetical protein
VVLWLFCLCCYLPCLILEKNAKRYTYVPQSVSYIGIKKAAKSLLFFIIEVLILT